MHPLAKLDHRFIWHPFTQMRDWLKREPILITKGRGALLQDAHGRQYLDANSSIWTNLHGHNHPKINKALAQQLRNIAHSSALGLANQPASLLAGRLVRAANAKQGPSGKGRRYAAPAPRRLAKVFFSDDGSTAIEVALKLAYEIARRTHGNKNPRFLSLGGGYHGDTIGAVSLGHIDRFHKAYSRLVFKTDYTMAPYCYRCPFNRAKPERADARLYRQCHWECLDQLERKVAIRKKKGAPYAGFVFEPLMQGAAGMIPQPEGWLGRAAQIARSHGALLIADEVMTGFGRTGFGAQTPATGGNRSDLQPHGIRPELRHLASRPEPILFATCKEGVRPDFLAMAKGLTGGYLPMAATLTTQGVFDAFLGEYEEFKTFFHGHSFTGNQLGAAAALANLDLLESPGCASSAMRLERALAEELKDLWALPNVGDIRQTGLIAGVELVKDWRTRQPFQPGERAAIRVCETMAKRGVLTRPVGDVVVLMPPYCMTRAQLQKTVAALADAISISKRAL